MDVKPDVAMLFSQEVSHDDTVTMETKMVILHYCWVILISLHYSNKPRLF